MRVRCSWFNEARYGLFIHWGAYSVGGRGEWVMNRERIPKDVYLRDFVEKFHAEKYDPTDWAEKAKHWGMGYIVLTTRHHDGFALWDSDVNPYNAAKLGPKKDLVSAYAEAVRAAGLKVGFYYSPAAWIHPDYPGPFYRDWPDDPSTWRSPEHRSRFIEYYRAELKELLTRYGKVDYLWFDGCAPWGDLDGDETMKMCRALQPGIIINNRLGKPYDVENCEQQICPADDGQDWEACMTAASRAWGYAKCRVWKHREDVIAMLLTCAGNAGNLLINVGPKPDGTMPDEAVNLFDSVGEWMKRNREAVSRSERCPFTWNHSTWITVRGNKIYHTFRYEAEGEFCWNECISKVRRVYALDSGEPLDFEQNGSRITVRGLTGDWLCRVLVIEVEGTPTPWKGSGRAESVSDIIPFSMDPQNNGNDHA